MAKIKNSIILCEKCNSALHLPKTIIEKMKFCPICSSRFNPPIEEIKKDLKLTVYPYIDTYGMDFVINTIKSIEMKDGISAREAVYKEYYSC